MHSASLRHLAQMILLSVLTHTHAVYFWHLKTDMTDYDRFKQVEKGPRGHLHFLVILILVLPVAGAFTRNLTPYFNLCWVLSQ